MATLLVIGGTGFFGKSILDSFQRGQLKEWKITNVIAMSRNARRLIDEAPSLLSSCVELINLDIGTTEYLPAADFVIHAAASSDARNYLNQPDLEHINIINGIKNYCRLAKIYHRNSKIVYVSSGAVYGAQSLNIDNITEDHILGSLGELSDGKRDYAKAKRDAETAISLLGLEGLSVSIARCFAFVGPWLPRDQHFAIGNFINDAINKKPIEIKSNRQAYRSYMYSDDLVAWLMKISMSADNKCSIYNVGSDEIISVKDLAKLIASKFNSEISIPSTVDDSIDIYVPSILKAKNILGLRLKYDLNSSIEETFNLISNKII